MKKLLKMIFPLLALALIVFCCFFYKPELVKTQSSQVIMGSVVSLTTYTDTEENGKTEQAAVFDKIKALDSLISKNDENAALYKINNSDSNENRIDPELFGYIKETADIYSKSDGKLAVTSGALTEAWGIDTEDFRLPSKDEIEAALPLCDDSLITLDSDKLTVKTAEGQIINLGSVGKGIACDKALEAVDVSSDQSAVVSVGGSVGLFGAKSKNEGWVIGIRDPYGSENDYFAKLNFGKLEYKGGAIIFVSTSGSYEKNFEADGKTYHHILDLTTGYPVETELVSVTVKADTGLLSDALSTLCFALGEEKSQSILDSYGASAVYVYADKTVSAYGELSDALEIVNADYKLR